MTFSLLLTAVIFFMGGSSEAETKPSRKIRSETSVSRGPASVEAPSRGPASTETAVHGPASASAAPRGPANSEPTVTCDAYSQWLKACRSPGSDEKGRRVNLRQLQNDFAQARAGNPEAHKLCSEVSALESCLSKLGGALAPANPREKLFKSDNSRELLHFGSMVLMKSGVPPARAPAQQKTPRN